MKKIYFVIALIATSVFFQNCGKQQSFDVKEDNSLAMSDFTEDSISPFDSTGRLESKASRKQMSLGGGWTQWPATNKIRVQLSVYDKTGYASVYVAAFYNKIWYFWDRTKSGSNRWVPIANIATTPRLPEVWAGVMPARYDAIITDIQLNAHGAKIYVGAGFGGSPEKRRSEMLGTNRFRYLMTIP